MSLISSILTHLFLERKTHSVILYKDFLIVAQMILWKEKFFEVKIKIHLEENGSHGYFRYRNFFGPSKYVSR